MFSSLSLPTSVWIGLFLTPSTIAIGQVLFKLASTKLETTNLAGFIRLSLDPLFIFAVLLYGAATFLWVYVLRSVPLHIANAFMATTFILVPLFSFMFLGEHISQKFIFGLALILGGIAVIGS